MWFALLGQRVGTAWTRGVSNATAIRNALEVMRIGSADSHQGQRRQATHKQAGYMTAPDFYLSKNLLPSGRGHIWD